MTERRYGQQQVARPEDRPPRPETVQRVGAPFGDVRRQGGAFESCPAATGQTDGDRCTVYPDGAHRCGRDRHMHIEHVCVCRKVAWVVRFHD